MVQQPCRGNCTSNACLNAFPLLEKKGIRNFFDAGIDGFDDGDVGEQSIPLLHPPATRHIGHEGPRGQQQDQHQRDAQAVILTQCVQPTVARRHHDPDSPQKADKYPFDHAVQPVQHPNGDGQGQPNQKACDEVFFEMHRISSVAGAGRATASAAPSPRIGGRGGRGGSGIRRLGIGFVGGGIGRPSGSV